MKTRILTLGVLVTVAFLTQALVAQRQGQDNDVPVIRAAVAAVRGMLPEEGIVRLDAAVVGQQKAQALGIETALGTARRSDVHVCESRSPRSCGLKDIVGLIEVASVQVEGVEAEVVLKLLSEIGSSRDPVNEKHLLVTLARENGRWRVIEINVIAVS